MIKKLIFIAMVLLPLSLCAQEQDAGGDPQAMPEQQEAGQSPKEKKSTKILTGFSGGIMIHGGYLFSDNPQKVFSSTKLGDLTHLPKDGFAMGLGATLRFHLIDHIHLGAEGFVSTMPMMGTGSNIRAGWGGAMCDFYSDMGKVRPLIGLGLGGGVMQRLYVPTEAATVTDPESDIVYNASYTKTPFFYLDPYVGMEIGMKGLMALIIRIDYVLQFGRSNSKLTTSDINWGNFMAPSGPRLHIGVLLGN